MALENSILGKTIIVTGAGKGIGRALAKKLDSLGAIVYAVSKNPDNLATLKSECFLLQTVCVDLKDWEATKVAIENIKGIDILINNAGNMISGHFLHITEQDLDTLFQVNFKAAVNVAQSVAAGMIQEGRRGSIVNISAVWGMKSMTTVAAHGSLKSGLDHMTKIMAIELGKHGIRVNSVNPTWVNRKTSDQGFAGFMARVSGEKLHEESMQRMPMKKYLIEVDEVINAILFHCSDLTPGATGVLLPVDGGLAAN